MAENQDYQNLISEIIAKQMVVLGPDIVLLKARSIAGLSVDDSGKVQSLTGDAQAILQQLVDKYIELSGQIVKNILSPVFAKYPQIKIAIK